MKRISSTWIFIIAALVIPLAVYAMYSLYEYRYERLPFYGKEGQRVQSFALTNQDGELTTLDMYKGKILVADFFFTRCPTICPKMTSNLKIVQDRFLKDTGLHIISFTVDPSRDDTTKLASYAKQYGINTKGWTFLTGDKKEIYKLARNSFMIAAIDGDGGPTDFIHSEKIVLLDKERRIRGFYDGTNENEIKELQNDIIKLKHEDK